MHYTVIINKLKCQYKTCRKEPILIGENCIYIDTNEKLYNEIIYEKIKIHQ